jgi:hypothetical protein
MACKKLRPQWGENDMTALTRRLDALEAAQRPVAPGAAGAGDGSGGAGDEALDPADGDGGTGEEVLDLADGNAVPQADHEAPDPENSDSNADGARGLADDAGADDQYVAAAGEQAAEDVVAGGVDEAGAAVAETAASASWLEDVADIVFGFLALF